MSFGPSNTTKTAENNLGGVSSTSLNQQFPMLNTQGSSLFNLGSQNVQSGTNFFNSVLNGNQANALTTLGPDIERIKQAHANTMTAINTLMPRGGGRFGASFGESLAPTSQIQSLFNGIRPAAATALPQIGLQQGAQGANLFGLANQSLGTAGSVNTSLADIGQRQQQINNSLFAGLGQGLFSLATTPFGGGSAANGLLGLIGKQP